MFNRLLKYLSKYVPCFSMPLDFSIPAANYISLSEAVKLFPQMDGKSPGRRTVKRWILTGCYGVRLWATKRGRFWVTTVAAVREFQDALTRNSLTEVTDTPEAEADAESDRAVEFLKTRGFFQGKDKDDGRNARRGARA